MAGQQQRLLSLVGVVALGATLSAQEAETQAPQRPLRPKLAAKMDSPELENVRKAIEALSPEQRKRFQENFARWANLSPEEKRALRDREDLRRKRMVQDIERAQETAGLQLQGDQKVQFARRYTEERRKLEEQLRKEMEEKRQPGIAAIISRLKQEFSGGAQSTSAPVAPSTAP